MYSVKHINWGYLIFSLFLSLGTGALAGFLTRDNTYIYSELNLPPLSPPSIVFPVVWSILYFLMGISAYIILQSDSPNAKSALFIYVIQLLLNFSWSIVFFNYQQYLASFIILVILWVLVLIMTIKFYRINKLAGILQIPYLLWISFAGYLNLGILLLNQK